MSPARKRLTPRKRPRQERAQATVEAILQAATYILVKDGWEGFNTNRVAERAGVNIASLYQYFPSKEAIAVELQRRHVEQARRAFPPAPGAPRSLKAMLRQMVLAGVNEHKVAPRLHRIFSEELPNLARQAQLDPAFLEAWGQRLAPLVRNVPDVALASEISRIAVHAVIHEIAHERPALLESPLLVDELVTLLERYWLRPAPRRPRAGVA
jgi:AcrR family transcriptional regulator